MEDRCTLFQEIRKTVMDAKEYFAEGADRLLDFVTDSDVLENVPVVSLAVKIWNIQRQLS
jgi:hypothetical protein